MQDRSLRRYKAYLHKVRAFHRLADKWTPEPSDRRLGIESTTRTLCSCHCCGNPKKHFGNSRRALSMQELRHLACWQDFQ